MRDSFTVPAEDADQIAAFTRVASAFDLLSTTSVRRSIFADPDPQIVLGISDKGLDAVAACVIRGVRSWVKFLAIHPARRRRGVGTRMLEEIESFCRTNGAMTIEVGSSAPYYVVPGIDARSTETSCFFEARGYKRVGEAVNLTARLLDLPEPPLPCRLAGDAELEAIRPWVTELHPNWINELERGVALDSCVVRDDVGFACIDVNREGWFGPIATHPEARGTGVGSATLLSALHLMRKRGHEHAEIAWATALPFYLKAVNAPVSRVFWTYAKTL